MRAYPDQGPSLRDQRREQQVPVSQFNGLRPSTARTTRPSQQRGVALAVALILLVVITLVGLAAVSGTIMQNKMASNQYDRELAFQSAEAALRAAEAVIAAPGFDPTPYTLCDGDDSRPPCDPNPFTGAGAGSGTPVDKATFGPSDNAEWSPQYIIENLGQWSAQGSSGSTQSANCKQYGACPAGQKVTYWRITARSGDPDVVGDHAIVTLQVIIRQ